MSFIIYNLQQPNYVARNNSYKKYISALSNHLHNLTENNFVSPRNDIIVCQFHNKSKPIWIYKNFHNLICNKNNHKITAKFASVGSLNQKQLINIPVNHCETCDEYFIGRNSLSIIQNAFGILLVKTCTCTPTQLSDINFSDYNSESELHSFGYNVIANKSSATERQQLLKYLIDNSIMSKFEIRRDIEHAINIFSNRDSHNKAVQAWKSDLSFVDSYLT